MSHLTLEKTVVSLIHSPHASVLTVAKWTDTEHHLRTERQADGGKALHVPKIDVV